jgi:regulatory protein
MKPPPDKTLQHALRFLKRKLLSRQELAEKLLARQYEEADVLRVLDLLTQKNILNDKRLADDRALVSAGRKVGRHNVTRKLDRAGIDESVAQRAVEGAYEVVDEAKAARELLDRKLHSMRGLPLITQHRRAFGFLLRRGYDEQIVHQVIEELLGPACDLTDTGEVEE